MTVFLITFDRREQHLISLEEFAEADREQAESARFDAELDALETGRDLEIVTLEAKSLDDIRHTHSSYFLETLPVPG